MTVGLEWCEAPPPGRGVGNGRNRDDVTVRAIARRDGWTCRLCGHPIDPALTGTRHLMSASRDRIVPGQPYTPANVQLAHLRCNIIRGDRPWTTSDDVVKTLLGWPVASFLVRPEPEDPGLKRLRRRREREAWATVCPLDDRPASALVEGKAGLVAVCAEHVELARGLGFSFRQDRRRAAAPPHPKTTDSG